MTQRLITCRLLREPEVSFNRLLDDAVEQGVAADEAWLGWKPRSWTPLLDVVGGNTVKTIIREGRPVPADEAFEAWTSGDVQRMTRALPLKTNPIDRHFLLINLCQQAYRRRHAEPAMRELARRVGLQHVQEFSDLRAPLVRDLGVLPRVHTFQILVWQRHGHGTV